MKLLLDTTYFLPVIGVSIKGFPRNIVVEFIRKGYEVLISEITLFELSAKGAKFIIAGVLSPGRVSRGIRALLYDDRVDKIPIYDTSILLTAFKLRRMLDDFIDCLILSSAINRADILITEDRDILEIFGKREFQDIIQTLNPKFKIGSFKSVS